jgi:hypothetical protein
MDWYSKLFVAVRCSQAFSAYFKVNCRVKQGSALSPALFNVFINKLITDNSGHGCCINRAWVGSIMYTNDAILLSISITGLQALLHQCIVLVKN